MMLERDWYVDQTHKLAERGPATAILTCGEVATCRADRVASVLRGQQYRKAAKRRVATTLRGSKWKLVRAITFDRQPLLWYYSLWFAFFRRSKPLKFRTVPTVASHTRRQPERRDTLTLRNAIARPTHFDKIKRPPIPTFRISAMASARLCIGAGNLVARENLPPWMEGSCC